MPTWTYIAQRALTGEFLDMDVPLARDELTWSLSGAGALRGTISPDVGRMRAPDGRLLLEEWGTLIYAEVDGDIRWGGIVISSQFENEKWTVEAAGFATYPHGLVYPGDLSTYTVDAFDIVPNIWAALQALPDSDLGVTIRKFGAPTLRIGVAPFTEYKNANGDWGPTPIDGAETRTNPGDPYELRWWDSKDCGQEIDTLAKQVPFDYIETHAWNGNTISHHIDLHWPRAGRQRDDLSFVQGSNVLNVVSPSIDGDDYANEVVGLGAGEGSAIVRRVVAVRDGRLRRSKVYTDKSVTDTARMDALIADELAWRRNTLEINSITVRDHPNAPIGSWQLGDDILVEADIPWLGLIAVWCRVTGWSLVSEHTANIELARIDTGG